MGLSYDEAALKIKTVTVDGEELNIFVWSVNCFVKESGYLNPAEIHFGYVSDCMNRRPFHPVVEREIDEVERIGIYIP